MPKTSTTKLLPPIQLAESKESAGTIVLGNGKPTFKLVEKSDISGSTLPSPQPQLPEPKLQSSSMVSSPVFSWQRFHEIAHELPPLFVQHRRELWLYPDVPLDPDWDRYYALDIAGTLRILTVRVDGALVGYLFGLFGPHLHSARALHSGVDMIWLDPVYRQGWTGFRLFKEFLRASKEAGVMVASVHVRTGFADGRVGKLLLRLGFAPVEVNYSRKV